MAVKDFYSISFKGELIAPLLKPSKVTGIVFKLTQELDNNSDIIVGLEAWFVSNSGNNLTRSRSIVVGELKSRLTTSLSQNFQCPNEFHLVYFDKADIEKILLHDINKHINSGELSINVDKYSTNLIDVNNFRVKQNDLLLTRIETNYGQFGNIYKTLKLETDPSVATNNARSANEVLAYEIGLSCPPIWYFGIINEANYPMILDLSKLKVDFKLKELKIRPSHPFFDIVKNI